MSGPLAGSRLRDLARGGPAGAPPAAEEEPAERCDLCGAGLPEEHRHLLDLESRELACACRACTILFDHRAAGGGHFKLIPERRLLLSDFQLTDLQWEELRVPVDMAFFFHSTREERVMAYYPSPMGPTESLLTLEAWTELEAANPVLAEMEHDTEALLVNRARGARQIFLVPIEDPYRLVALIRTRWRGFTGGKEVWEELERFFTDLEGRAQQVEAGGGQADTSAAEAAGRS